MNLVLVTAVLAVCGADKLDRTYLPPASATTAGGSPGSLQTPFRTFNQGLGGIPKGSYSNDFEGVVVDAAAPGTRASGGDDTGLGGPRISYGSTDSKVGEAAFTADVAFPRVGVHSGLNSPGTFGAQQQVEARPERVQSSRDRVSNIVKYESDVSPDSFNYAFETDNGIVAEENGIEVNGVKAQGGYSYTGDDGQVYSVTYTADEEGYRPKGDHLPTPPPIPVEILKSLEKNAQDEAAGVIDDGSYDAQKYNTGEDYTKSDNANGQYNGGQPSQVGNRPQSDAVASGSFISQNNQGFVRPNSNQFGSNPSFDSSKGVPSNGNIAVGSNSNRPIQNAQIGFGIGTNNEYLPPTNVFNQNRRPDVNNRPSSTQTDPQTASSFNVNSGIDKNKNKDIPSFVPLSQQELQKDKPKRPQANTPIFGKPTLIDSTLSIKDPFARVPSRNKFPENKRPSQNPQSIGGSFQVVSGNVYSSKNEYRQSNRPNQYYGNQSLQGTSSIQSNQKFPGSQVLGPNLPSANAFASVTRPSSVYQQSQQYSAQAPQYTNSFSNQINTSPGSRPQQSHSSGLFGASSFNKSPESQPQYKPLTFAPQLTTLQPQTELTTPLESNSDQNKAPLPIPVIDGPDAPSPTSFFNLPSFGSRPIIGQHSFNSNKIQQISPTSSSTINNQSFTANFQNSAKPGILEGNFGLQSKFPFKLGVNTPSSFSTGRPTFGQYNQQQGSNDSYYYNTPSKPFNSPTPRPQGSPFPSSPFDQSFKESQTPFNTVSQLPNTPASFFTPQNNKPLDSTKYPKPSSLGPISPTLPTREGEQNVNTFQSQENKLTQATTSSFFSPKPTASVDSERNQFGQLGSRPFQQTNNLNKENQKLNQPGSSFSQATASVEPATSGSASFKPLIDNTKPTTNQDISSQSQQTQSYGGEVYEYKKPLQTLPAPQNGATSGQFGQTSQFGSTVTTPQFGQTQTSGSFKPGSQFGSQFNQPSTNGQQPQNSQIPQEKPSFSPNSQTQTQLKPGQFVSQPSNPSLNPQPIQGASKFPPAYNNQSPSCCKQNRFASQSSQAEEHDKTPQFGDQYSPNQGFSQQESGPGNNQFGDQYNPNQGFSQQESGPGNKPTQSVSSFAGVGENFGGPRKPPSFDETGYHY